MQRIELEKYKKVQRISKDTIEYLGSFIHKGVSEAGIATAANKFMISKGVSSFWYYGLGALVLVGDRTTLSVSGKEYVPSEKKVGETDLVTVDLSPEIDSFWGDYARSFVVANGRVINKASAANQQSVKQLFEGIDTEKMLHQKMQKIADPLMTFEELYLAMNRLIKEKGYVNLDFKGNLGHSIEKDRDKRIYIEKGNKAKLSDAGLFAFEPHIKAKSGNFGYKMEDIYYFSRGKVTGSIGSSPP